MSTASVGSFPGGTSHFGVLDGVGSVWPWTCSRNADEEVALKGGWWMQATWGLGDNRIVYSDPELGTFITGFRVAFGVARTPPAGPTAARSVNRSGAADSNPVAPCCAVPPSFDVQRHDHASS